MERCIVKSDGVDVKRRKEKKRKQDPDIIPLFRELKPCSTPYEAGATTIFLKEKMG